ncbi:MAG: hypothetical protein ABI600_09355 [Luteolibacter sp.]
MKSHWIEETVSHCSPMGLGDSECKTSDSETSEFAKRIPHSRRQIAAPCYDSKRSTGILAGMTVSGVPTFAKILAIPAG